MGDWASVEDGRDRERRRRAAEYVAAAGLAAERERRAFLSSGPARGILFDLLGAGTVAATDEEAAR